MQKLIETFVATHKSYEFPKDSGYIPLHVGRALSASDLGITGDHTGDNISERNRNFCELTGLYWIWKNKKDSKIVGLVHYRRYFKASDTAALAALLDGHKIILPKPRNYWIESIEEHYKNAHRIEDLHSVRNIILNKYPEYTTAFDKVMKGKKLSLFNMFVMEREQFENYCSWLFDILFEAEKVIPYKDYGPYQGRVFGFLSERLLNVWVAHNLKPQEIKYLSVVNLEGENLFKKAIGLLKRKFTGVKPN